MIFYISEILFLNLGVVCQGSNGLWVFATCLRFLKYSYFDLGQYKVTKNGIINLLSFRGDFHVFTSRLVYKGRKILKFFSHN